MNGSKPDRLGDEQGLANPDANAQAQTRVVFPLAPALSPREREMLTPTSGLSKAHRISPRPRTLFPLLGERARVRGNATSATRRFRTSHGTVELFESPGS